MHTYDHFKYAKPPVKRRYDVTWRSRNSSKNYGRRIVKATDALTAIPAARQMRGVPPDAVITHVELIR